MLAHIIVYIAMPQHMYTHLEISCVFHDELELQTVALDIFQETQNALS